MPTSLFFSRFAGLLLVAASARGAVVQGVVVDNRTGQPLARSRVTIAGPGGSTILSGSSGQFTFSGLPGGAYTLSAARAGYAIAKYGQKDWRAPGTPIVLDKDGSFSVVLRLRKTGVVAGEVLDENRVPMPLVPVYAYRAGARLDLKGGTTTDDRGAFRIAGLELGRYYIRTGARLLEDRTGLLPTFFGQTARAAEARVVAVNLEEETGGVVITPLAGSLSTLFGVVSGGAGATVTLFTDTGKREAGTDAAGNFQFDQLPPGRYEVMAAAGSLAAWQQVSVAKESESVTLELAPAPVLHLRCQEKAGNPLDTRGVSIFLRRREPPEETSRRFVCGDAPALTPGLWDLAAAAPPEMYVESVRAGRAGSQSREVQLRPGQSEDALLTFSTKPATLRGKVLTEDGQPALFAPVYLNPIEPDLRSRTGGVRTSRTDQDGEFLLAGLAPGRYEVVSSFGVADSGEEDWSPGRGRPVELKEGQAAKVEIALTNP